MLMQILNKKWPLIIICLSFLGFSNLSCNSFMGISSNTDSLEILVVREEGVLDQDFNLFKKHFFLPQQAITETELTGDLYNMFNVICIQRSDFSEYFKGFQNIVFISSGETFSVKKIKDKWTQRQTVCYFSLDSLADETFFEKETRKLIEQIKDSEIERRITKYQTNKEINNIVQKEFKLSISLPTGFFVVDTDDGFIDLRRDFETGVHRLIVQELVSTESQDLDSTINMINQVLEENVEGEIEGSFAALDDVYANIYTEQTKTSNQEIIGIRALWRIKNDPAPMGGPFVGYVLKNRNSDKSLFFIFCIFAPGEDKANHLIEAEAIAKSLFY